MTGSRHKPPLPFHKFALRVLQHVAVAQILVVFSLILGMWGYEHYESMGWRDAFVNTAMLLGGMGPMKTDGLSDAGKVFAGIYALYAGLVFIIVVGIIMTPVIHHALHVFHWQEDDHTQGS